MLWFVVYFVCFFFETFGVCGCLLVLLFFFVLFWLVGVVWVLSLAWVFGFGSVIFSFSCFLLWVLLLLSFDFLLCLVLGVFCSFVVFVVLCWVCFLFWLHFCWVFRW